MPDPTYKTVDIPGYPEGVDFPASMTDDQINLAAARLYSQKKAELDAAKPDSSRDASIPIAGLSVAGASKAVPALARGAMELATNPNVPKASAAVGRVLGGVAPVVGGFAEGGPVGGLVGLAAAAKGAWVGGKTGWFTGKLLQNLSAPAAKVLTTIAPYAELVSGPLLASFSAEGEALGRLNDPKELEKLKSGAVERLRARMNAPDLANNPSARAGIAASIKKLGGTP